MQVPLNASTVVANVTAINTSGSGMSYLQVYAVGTTPSATSNVDVGAGATVNNQVTTGIGNNSSEAAGTTIYNSADNVNVVVDIEGYTRPVRGHDYVPITPQRICDTALGTLRPFQPLQPGQRCPHRW